MPVKILIIIVFKPLKLITFSQVIISLIIIKFHSESESVKGTEMVNYSLSLYLGVCRIYYKAIRTLAHVQAAMIQQQNNQQWNKASLGKHCSQDMRFILRMRTIHMSLI